MIDKYWETSKRIVFIVIENFNREYSGKLLLAEELSSQGYLVFLGHKSIIRTLIKINPIKNSIYIEKGLNKGFGVGKRIKEAKDSGIIIFSFDEEALMHTDSANYANFNHELESIKNIEGIFCWGKKHHHLLKSIGYDEKQIIKTGNPRFDIYKIRSKKYTEEKYPRKNILICSRFCMQRASEMLQGNEKYMEPTEILYQKFLKIPKILRDSNIDIPILIRPHPSESFEPWLDSTSGLKNILVSYSGPVEKTFNKSLLMIHNRCTTGIEAFMSNLPVISYDPIKLEEPPHPPSDFINSFANSVAFTEDDLICQVKNLLKNKNLPTIKNVSQENYLYNHDKLNYIEITKYLIKNYPPNHENKNKISLLKIYFLIFLIYSYHKFHKILLYIFNYSKYSYIKKKTARSFKISLNSKRKNIYFSLFKFFNVEIYFPFKP